jgi:hypothetical protein
MEYGETQMSVDWLESKIQNYLATYGSISPKMISVFASYSKTIHKKEHEITYNQYLMSNYQTFEHYYEETFKK